MSEYCQGCKERQDKIDELEGRFSDSLDELVRCPNCKKEYDTNFHREWMTECMDSHAHIKCECGATFWIKAIPQNILWKVTPNV